MFHFWIWKILHIQKWNIPLNEFFQNTEIENFYTIILKSAAGQIEPLSGPHLARGPYLPIIALNHGIHNNMYMN